MTSKTFDKTKLQSTHTPPPDPVYIRAMRVAPNAVYESTIENIHDPAELRKVADAFDHVHLPAFAEALRRRATLHSLSEGARKVLLESFRAAILSGDPAQMRTVGKELEERGAVHSARVLYDAASELPDGSDAA
jgi:hypothetical protein